MPPSFAFAIDLLRLKGIVDFGDGPVHVESVFDRWTEQPATARQPRFGLTLIGWKITAQELTGVFRPALTPPIVSLENGSPLSEVEEY